MSRTRLEVKRDEAGGWVHVRVASDGPRGTGHLAVRVLDHGIDGARVALVAEGALLVARDDVGLDVCVGAGVSLDIVEPAGTVAYDMRGGSARWTVSVDLGDSAALVWRAQPFIVSSGARVHRSLNVRLNGSAGATLRETIVLGRVGEDGGELDQRTRVVDDLGPVLAEDMALDGARGRVGVLAGYRIVDTVSLLGKRAPRVLAPDGAHRFDLEASGTLLRYLGSQTHLSPLDDTWRTVRSGATELARSPSRTRG